MQNDWRSHPAWGPTQAIVGGVGVLIALIDIDISIVIKVVILIGAFGACIYTFWSKKPLPLLLNLTQASSSAVASPSKLTNPRDKSNVQVPGVLSHRPVPQQESNILKVAEKTGNTDLAKSSDASKKEVNERYIGSVSNENITHEVTEKPGATESASKTEEMSTSLSWKDSILGLLGITIMYGIPGILLFRSGIGLLHIVGIALLVLFGLTVVGIVIGFIANKIEPVGADAA